MVGATSSEGLLVKMCRSKVKFCWHWQFRSYQQCANLLPISHHLSCDVLFDQSVFEHAGHTGAQSRQVQTDEIGYSFALVQMVFLCHHLAKEVLVSYVIDR